MRESLIKELDKRLDLDIDKLLTSPTLEVKLSPAALDKQCIELYEYIAAGPSGDVLRIIGGGQEVAMQHRYMKRQALKQLQADRARNVTTPFFFNIMNNTAEKEGSASQQVRWTMRRNLPRNSTGTLPTHFSLPQNSDSKQKTATQKEENNMRMSIIQPSQKSSNLQSLSSSWGGVAVPAPSRLMTNARILSSCRSRKGLSILI